mmetsp:Transcript_27291/g.68555  ORF Transcript_27291/g.68555 Transcript_27291/m.68555 type:complete len:224 (-) Transcript_27291:704-1375(-)
MRSWPSEGPKTMRKKRPTRKRIIEKKASTHTSEGIPMMKPTSMLARSRSNGESTSRSKRMTRTKRSARNMTATRIALATIHPSPMPSPATISAMLRESSITAMNVTPKSVVFQIQSGPRKNSRTPKWKILITNSARNTDTQTASKMNQPTCEGEWSTLIANANMFTPTTVMTNELRWRSQAFESESSLFSPSAMRRATVSTISSRVGFRRAAIIMFTSFRAAS